MTARNPQNSLSFPVPPALDCASKEHGHSGREEKEMKKGYLGILAILCMACVMEEDTGKVKGPEHVGDGKWMLGDSVVLFEMNFPNWKAEINSAPRYVVSGTATLQFIDTLRLGSSSRIQTFFNCRITAYEITKKGVHNEPDSVLLARTFSGPDANGFYNPGFVHYLAWNDSTNWRQESGGWNGYSLEKQ